MNDIHVLALAGGVGGAKLARGFQEVLPPGNLTVLVNTADDFEHWGLAVCPDLDTVMYNLADMNNPETGWGRVEESYNTLNAVGQIGGEDWFILGDRDLAVHLRRSEWLRQSIPLTEVTDRLRRSFGIPSSILPMSDQPVRTLVHTDEGDLPFQHYFVRRSCEPLVIDLTYVGAEQARMTPEVNDAIDRADLIVFCPSNPYLSIDPILSIPSLRSALLRSKSPQIAVTPIVGGQALKGPAAKMMREMGKMTSPLTVADHYVNFLSGFVLDEEDAVLRDSLDIPVLVLDTVMTSLEVKAQLAQSVLDFGMTMLPSATKSSTSTSSVQVTPALTEIGN